MAREVTDEIQEKRVEKGEKRRGSRKERETGSFGKGEKRYRRT